MKLAKGLADLGQRRSGQGPLKSSVEWAHRELTAGGGGENGKWESCGVGGGWKLRTWESESPGQVWGCPVSHWTGISLSALGNQPVKKQLSVQGRRATQTTWREKENALIPCALNRGASHHPGSGVEFQQPFLRAYCVSHNPNSCSSLKLLEENLPSREPLCQSYVCLCASYCMHACAQAMWGCFQAIIC